jgi:hypothetical protein
LGDDPSRTPFRRLTRVQRVWGLAAATGLTALGGCCALRSTPTEPATAAEVHAHIEELRASTPAGFTLIALPPFVVIGDAAPETVRDDAKQVVEWASTRLRADYFDRDPGGLVDVWLFRDQQSYESNVSAIFGSVPETPYGYYSPCHRALIMNVSTGYGTLVHEMVHAYMAANFPDVPVWFNEGLASLYEQPSDRDGHLVGGVNWRLPRLQDAIRDHRTKPLTEVIAGSRGDFNGKEGSLYYAEARYLCFYLQGEGKLVRFYRRFHDRSASDARGLATLQQVLGVNDLNRFQTTWEAYVLGLAYPERRKSP